MSSHLLYRRVVYQLHLLMMALVLLLHDDLLHFLGVQDQAVFCAPCWQSLHLAVHHNGIISKLYNDVVEVCRGAVLFAEGVQHTALWGADG